MSSNYCYYYAVVRKRAKKRLLALMNVMLIYFVCESLLIIIK